MATKKDKAETGVDLADEALGVIGGPPAEGYEFFEHGDKGVNLYELDPEAVDDDIIINTQDKPQIIPRGQFRNSTIRLLKGDRIKGKYYRDLVVKHKAVGLQLCCKLTREHLADLDRERQKRTGDEPPEWVKEAWAKKSDESTREALRGRR